MKADIGSSRRSICDWLAARCTWLVCPWRGNGAGNVACSQRLALGSCKTFFAKLTFLIILLVGPVTYTHNVHTHTHLHSHAHAQRALACLIFVAYFSALFCLCRFLFVFDCLCGRRRLITLLKSARRT